MLDILLGGDLEEPLPPRLLGLAEYQSTLPSMLKLHETP